MRHENHNKKGKMSKKKPTTFRNLDIKAGNTQNTLLSIASKVNPCHNVEIGQSPAVTWWKPAQQ